MIKRLGLTFVAVAISFCTHGQGSVNFNTQQLGVVARISNCGVGLSGTAYLAQLFAVPGLASSDSSLKPIGKPVYFRSGVNAGYVQTVGLVQTANR